jgi:hypothetical protein
VRDAGRGGGGIFGGKVIGHLTVSGLFIVRIVIRFIFIVEFAQVQLVDKILENGQAVLRPRHGRRTLRDPSLHIGLRRDRLSARSGGQR